METSTIYNMSNIDNSQMDIEQQAVWNGPRANAWVEAQELLDRMFQPFEDLLVEAAAGATAVLDVGCGTGATTLGIARRLGESGRVVGADISEPMLALARARAEREGSAATFVLANAETHAFEPARFDLIVSRFGVMFFEDPVRAFANLRRAAKENGECRFIVWRSPEDNPFMTAAERAAAPLLPDLPPRQPDAPGQFGLADADRVRRIFDESGWSDVDVRAIDILCSFPRGELGRYAAKLGPVGQALERDDETREKVIEVVLASFEPYVHGEEVRFNAACWMIAARAC